MNHFRGIPGDPVLLVWWHAHRLKRMMDLQRPSGIKLWVHYYEMVNQKRARTPAPTATPT